MIGKTERDTLATVPATAKIQRGISYTYACEHCEKCECSTPILKAEASTPLIKGSIASPETVAHIMVQKFVMVSPLYRQEQEWERRGIPLSRQTMSNWLLKCIEDYLTPVYEIIKQQLVQHDVLQANETTLQVLQEEGTKPQRLEISNNRAERSIKPFVIGRKNFLFANTARGAQASAVMYSLAETAKENGIDPYAYLAWLLRAVAEFDLKANPQATTQLRNHHPIFF